MTTLHANTPRDAVHRLELLAGFAGYNGSDATFRGQVSAAIQLIVHVARLPTGERRLMSVAELVGHDESGIRLKDIFRYDVQGRVHHDLRETNA
jgi:pilus assembly protein CpaF